jgi:hypothetical protein
MQGESDHDDEDLLGDLYEGLDPELRAHMVGFGQEDMDIELQLQKVSPNSMRPDAYYRLSMIMS